MKSYTIMALVFKSLNQLAKNIFGPQDQQYVRLKSSETIDAVDLIRIVGRKVRP